MAEYIERGELEGILKTKYEKLAGKRPDFYAGFMFAVLVIDNETRNADVAPVRHGKWGNYEPHSDGYRCSCCKLVHRACTRYCPNCGARMDEEE